MEEIKPELLVEEFLDSIEERANKNFKDHLHQAFIDWYIEAEYGHLKWEFTDGPNDGGIDAIVWRKPDDKPPVIIIQSKFSEKVGHHTLQKSAYREFKGVVDAYYRGEGVFKEFLDGVAAELRKIYLKAFRLLDGNWSNEKKAFKLITTLNRISKIEFQLIP